MDLKDFTDDELERLRISVAVEQERRWTMRTVPDQMDKLVRDMLAASGQVDGAEWVQPTDATNAYPKDWTVTHDGKTWVSLTPANVWEPGVSGWREVVEEGETPEWVQPTGATDAYNKGDRVSYNGKVYESVIDGNVWSVDEYPAGWSLIG